MTPAAKLRAVKSKALAWVEAKRALEGYANGCALSGAKINDERMAALTGKYLGAERDLEAAVEAEGSQ